MVPCGGRNLPRPLKRKRETTTTTLLLLLLLVLQLLPLLLVPLLLLLLPFNFCTRARSSSPLMTSTPPGPWGMPGPPGPNYSSRCPRPLCSRRGKWYSSGQRNHGTIVFPPLQPLPAGTGQTSAQEAEKEHIAYLPDTGAKTLWETVNIVSETHHRATSSS